jgi:hypothetical protein
MLLLCVPYVCVLPHGLIVTQDSLAVIKGIYSLILVLFLLFMTFLYCVYVCGCKRAWNCPNVIIEKLRREAIICKPCNFPFITMRLTVYVYNASFWSSVSMLCDGTELVLGMCLLWAFTRRCSILVYNCLGSLTLETIYSLTVSLSPCVLSENKKKGIRVKVKI